MYTIGNIVYGVPMPWKSDETRKVAAAHALDKSIAAKWIPLYNVGCTNADDQVADGDGEELAVRIENGDTEEEFKEWLEPFGWEFAYHGGADTSPGWLGVKIGQIDESDHLPIADIPQPTDEQRAEAKAKYDALPEGVREMLQPLALYIVWSSS